MQVSNVMGREQRHKHGIAIRGASDRLSRCSVSTKLLITSDYSVFVNVTDTTPAVDLIGRLFRVVITREGVRLVWSHSTTTSEVEYYGQTSFEWHRRINQH